MGNSGESSGDQNAARNVDSKGQFHEVLKENEDSVWN